MGHRHRERWRASLARCRWRGYRFAFVYPDGLRGYEWPRCGKETGISLAAARPRPRR